MSNPIVFDHTSDDICKACSIAPDKVAVIGRAIMTHMTFGGPTSKLIENLDKLDLNAAEVFFAGMTFMGLAAAEASEKSDKGVVLTS